jgi:hypothetical protein
MPEESSCPHCSAPAEGLVCGFCGAVLTALDTAESEFEALDQFHRSLSEKDLAAQARLLRGGFIPSHARSLIEAGLRCAPLIDSDAIRESAVKGAIYRLKVIVSKLKLLPATAESVRAVTHFESVLKAYEKEDERNVLYGFLLIGGLTVLVGALVVLIVYFFVR